MLGGGGGLLKSQIDVELMIEFPAHFPVFNAVPTVPPLNLRFTAHGKRKLVLSWNQPDTRVWSGNATRYKICYSNQERASRLRCSETTRLQYEITSLQPATRYFVTVSAGTSYGFGPKSAEVSEMTYGCM